MSERTPQSLEAVKALYETSLAEHGASPKGVGWRDDETHRLRFERLAALLELAERPSINDLGCGYGAFLEYLASRGIEPALFRGIDISERMLAEARRRHPAAEWVLGDRIPAEADYSFASGIFNVRLEASEAAWRSQIEATLEHLSERSRRGFAFNLLTSYVDYREPHLYYGDPCEFFDLCKRRFSRKVALLHDYPLYEWTLLVRK